MFQSLINKQFNCVRKIISLFVVVSFVLSNIVFPSQATAQSGIILPLPGTMIGTSIAYSPAAIWGINIQKDNPFQFDFLIGKGDSQLKGEAFKKESNKLIKYFLASLTVPEKEMWVNLSPYEQNRIIPDQFGETEMGRDLLAQDYLLKQLTASLMYPEDELGSAFWQRVHAKARDQYGTDKIEFNTFNKVWIVPEEIKVYEHEKGAFIASSYLKVLLEEDYLALEANKNSIEHGLGIVEEKDLKPITDIQSQIIRELIIPELEREVNEGKTFANLRQIFHSMILAAWYKRVLSKSILGQGYVDQNKVRGVDHQNPHANQSIYKQYVKAFEVGVFDFIKEDFEPKMQELIPRKYFSGGVKSDVDVAMSVHTNELAYDVAQKAFGEKLHTVATSINPISSFDSAMNSIESLFESQEKLESYIHEMKSTYLKDVDQINHVRELLLRYFGSTITAVEPLQESQADLMHELIRSMQMEDMVRYIYSKMSPRDQMDVFELKAILDQFVLRKNKYLQELLSSKEFKATKNYDFASNEKFERKIFAYFDGNTWTLTDESLPSWVIERNLPFKIIAGYESDHAMSVEDIGDKELDALAIELERMQTGKEPIKEDRETIRMRSPQNRKPGDTKTRITSGLKKKTIKVAKNRTKTQSIKRRPTKVRKKRASEHNFFVHVGGVGVIITEQVFQNAVLVNNQKLLSAILKNEAMFIHRLKFELLKGMGMLSEGSIIYYRGSEKRDDTILARVSKVFESKEEVELEILASSSKKIEKRIFKISHLVAEGARVHEEIKNDVAMSADLIDSLSKIASDPVMSISEVDHAMSEDDLDGLSEEQLLDLLEQRQTGNKPNIEARGSPKVRTPKKKKTKEKQTKKTGDQKKRQTARAVKPGKVRSKSHTTKSRVKKVNRYRGRQVNPNPPPITVAPRDKGNVVVERRFGNILGLSLKSPIFTQNDKAMVAKFNELSNKGKEIVEDLKENLKGYGLDEIATRLLALQLSFVGVSAISTFDDSLAKNAHVREIKLFYKALSDDFKQEYEIVGPLTFLDFLKDVVLVNVTNISGKIDKTQWNTPIRVKAQEQSQEIAFKGEGYLTIQKDDEEVVVFQLFYNRGIASLNLKTENREYFVFANDLKFWELEKNVKDLGINITYHSNGPSSGRIVIHNLNEETDVRFTLSRNEDYKGKLSNLIKPAEEVEKKEKALRAIRLALVELHANLDRPATQANNFIEMYLTIALWEYYNRKIPSGELMIRVKNLIQFTKEKSFKDLEIGEDYFTLIFIFQTLSKGGIKFSLEHLFDFINEYDHAMVAFKDNKDFKYIVNQVALLIKQHSKGNLPEIDHIFNLSVEFEKRFKSLLIAYEDNQSELLIVQSIFSELIRKFRVNYKMRDRAIEAFILGLKTEVAHLLLQLQQINRIDTLINANVPLKTTKKSKKKKKKKRISAPVDKNKSLGRYYKKASKRAPDEVFKRALLNKSPWSKPKLKQMLFEENNVLDQLNFSQLVNISDLRLGQIIYTINPTNGNESILATVSNIEDNDITLDIIVSSTDDSSRRVWFFETMKRAKALKYDRTTSAEDQAMMNVLNLNSDLALLGMDFVSWPEMFEMSSLIAAIYSSHLNSKAAITDISKQELSSKRHKLLALIFVPFFGLTSYYGDGGKISMLFSIIFGSFTYLNVRNIFDLKEIDNNRDSAQLGGIDLNPTISEMQIEQKEGGFVIPSFNSPLPKVNIEGLTPVIINITPIQNPLPLLGLADFPFEEDKLPLELVYKINQLKAIEPEELSLLLN